MNDLGEAKNILWIKIPHARNELMIDQSQHARSIVKDFYLPGTKIN